MDKVSLTIDDVEVEVKKDATVLEAAQEAGKYIPSLCSHPDLLSSREVKGVKVIYRGSEAIETDSDKEYEGCQLCVVEIEGMSGFPAACTTTVQEGMVVRTNTEVVQELRRQNLALILADHPHACLSCAQKEGCDRKQCSLNIRDEERCCPLLGHCDLQKVAEYIGISKQTPRYTFADLPRIEDEPLFKRDYNLCIGCTRCVRVCQEVRGVGALGFVWQNNKVIVGTVAPSLNDSACKFCGACVEVCPTGALTDREARWTGEALIRCKKSCPVGLDVPRYIRLVAEEKFAEALAVLREKVPFPLILGHVCARPCESQCRRSEVNEPIAICDLKRFVAEQGEGWEPKCAPPTDKRIAIVGAGPAGLSAAYYLAKLGHSVTVFEALPELGGMMRVGIPEYRLPKDVLSKEIQYIEKLGVKIETNTKVGEQVKLEDLRSAYQAILVATGAHRSLRLGVPGEETSGVIDGVDFLRAVNLGQKIEIGGRVAVIGGGNTAIDAARVARRLGCSVTIVYRRSRQEMPATPAEVEAAEAEGIEIMFLAAPTRVMAKEDKVEKIECVRMQLGEPDASGRPRPIPIEGSEFTIDVDTLIRALGQAPDLEFTKGLGLQFSPRGTLGVDEANLATNVEAVFAGGDVVSGPALVVEAIAAGRKAAISIDKYLGGKGEIDTPLLEAKQPSSWLGREEGFADKPRIQMPCLGVEERLKGFTPVELGFNKEMAVQEAKRCLQCDLRLQISLSTLPPEKAIVLEFTPEEVSTVPEGEGVYQLLDEGRAIIYIAGAMDLRKALQENLSEPSMSKARYFRYEENDMYTVRESELIQQFMQEHGSMPELNEEMLF